MPFNPETKYNPREVNALRLKNLTEDGFQLVDKGHVTSALATASAVPGSQVFSTYVDPQTKKKVCMFYPTLDTTQVAGTSKMKGTFSLKAAIRIYKDAIQINPALKSTTLSFVINTNRLGRKHFIPLNIELDNNGKIISAVLIESMSGASARLYPKKYIREAVKLLDPEAKLKVRYLGQQNNDYDCGPFAVRNSHALIVANAVDKKLRITPEQRMKDKKIWDGLATTDTFIQPTLMDSQENAIDDIDFEVTAADNEKTVTQTETSIPLHENHLTPKQATTLVPVFRFKDDLAIVKAEYIQAKKQSRPELTTKPDSEIFSKRYIADFENALNKTRPGFFAKLFKTDEWKKYSALHDELQKEKMAWVTYKRELIHGMKNSDDNALRQAAMEKIDRYKKTIQENPSARKLFWKEHAKYQQSEEHTTPILLGVLEILRE